MSEIRIFTLDVAERTLPLLRRILADLKQEYDVWREALAHYELLAGGSQANAGASMKLIDARMAVSTAADRIDKFLAEIDSIGCLFKGFEEGLVDFYALREDRLVLLCWKHGEEHITHWHEVDAGFPGRQPIDAGDFSGVIP